MAEKFINFVAIAKAGTEKTIIPSGINGENTSFVGDNANEGSNSRDVNSTVIVNGLYISGTATDAAYNFSLFIKDSNYPSRPITVVQNIPIPVHTGFFLERAITLLPTQYLSILAPEAQNPSNGILHISASSIEVID